METNWMMTRQNAASPLIKSHEAVRAGKQKHCSPLTTSDPGDSSPPALKGVSGWGACEGMCACGCWVLGAGREDLKGILGRLRSRLNLDICETPPM